MKHLPKVIDLFAGAGGLSLGAARANFHVCGAVETDNFALDTHKLNFPASEHVDADIATLNADLLLQKLKLKSGELFGIIGGPPCQGFSTIGKMEIDDPRNTLFMHFFRLVKELRPAFFLAENVTGILHPKYDEIRNNIFENLPSCYEVIKPLRIKASDYGAPTTRTRIFFIGYDPKRFTLSLHAEHFEPETNCSTSVQKALKGLPLEIPVNSATKDLGWQNLTSFSRASDFFYNKMSGSIPEGVGNNEYINRYTSGQVSGCFGTKHSAEVKARYAALAYGEQDKVSKSIKLDPYGLCPTLRAGTGPEKGSFQAVRPIHYDIPRVITPREAARLQGFPDWFVFQPTIWHSFRQIGNSVSPIVAEEILGAIYKAI